MKPWMKFVLALIPVLVTAVITTLTAVQGAGNKATALRNHDAAWLVQHPGRQNVGSYDKAMKTDMIAFRESVDAATKDTGKVLVQPTTLGRMFGVRARLVSVKALRNVPPRPAGIHGE
jgi:hypothetical protein